MDTYCSQLKVVSKEKFELEKKHESVKDALSKSEAQAKKAMELEANIICMKENEKQSQSKLKKIEQELGIEKKKNEEKDIKIGNLSNVLERTQDYLKIEKEKVKELE